MTQEEKDRVIADYNTRFEDLKESLSEMDKNSEEYHDYVGLLMHMSEKTNEKVISEHHYREAVKRNKERYNQ